MRLVLLSAVFSYTVSIVPIFYLGVAILVPTRQASSPLLSTLVLTRPRSTIPFYVLSLVERVDGSMMCMMRGRAKVS